MEFTITTDGIIKTAALVAAIVVLVGYFCKAYTMYLKWQKYDKELNDIREEQCMQTYVLSSVLDGLHQLGCNGPTTEASIALEKFVNKRAHKMETDNKEK